MLSHTTRYILAALFLLVPSLSAGEWFVSPQGNDTWSGRKPDAVEGGGDGPFASLDRAKEAIRASRKAGDSGPQTVSVRGGVYRIKEAFALGEKDSGEEGAPVIWRAFPGEYPVLNGAVALKDWTLWKDGVYKAQFESAPNGKMPRQLLLDGKRQTLARYPNAVPEDPVAGGWAFADGQQWPMYTDIPGEDKRTLQVKPQDWRQWSHPEHAEIFVFPRFNWWNNRVRVKSVDAGSLKVTLASDCSYPIRSGDRYFCQNILEELDTPGEWHVDLPNRMIYFWPPDGRRPEEASAVVAQTLVRLAPGAHDIVWRGFVMEGSDATAVALEETQRCVVEYNWIRAVGDFNGHGVSVSKGADNRVRYNTLEQIGHTGIMLTGGDVPTLTQANNVAEHNEIRDFGVYYKQGVGIQVLGVGNRALHNHIHHGPRFGIWLGGNCNEIAYNHIHDVCLETEDTGAIYSNGRDWLTPRGTTIAYNFIHDIPGFSMHEGKVVSPNFAWGIYLDDNSGGADVFGNIVARCGRGGLHGHAARDCVIQNNIFVGNKDWQVDFHGWTSQHTAWPKFLPAMTKNYESVAREEAWKNMRGMTLHPEETALPNGLTMRGNHMLKNILVSNKEETPVLSILSVPFTHNRFDYNLYWAPGGQVFTGFRSGGPNEGENLLRPLNGESNAMPQGWRWLSKPKGHPLAATHRGEDGVTCFSLSAENEEDPNKHPGVLSEEVPLQPGATYRLSARVRATMPGRASLNVYSFVPKVYGWNNPQNGVEVSAEWAYHEWVFEVPSPGKPGWNEQMKQFWVRIAWRSNNGTLEVSELKLHRVTPNSQWDSWRANGVDEHALVADPLWDDPERFTLRKDSPAWRLGFERIPVELIGPHPENH